MRSMVGRHEGEFAASRKVIELYLKLFRRRRALGVLRLGAQNKKARIHRRIRAVVR